VINATGHKVELQWKRTSWGLYNTCA